MKLDHFLIPDTKINSGWRNANLETIKLLEESIANTLFDIRNNILGMFPQSRETKAKISKWYYIKLKSFSTEKETISKTKRQPAEWRRYSMKC